MERIKKELSNAPLVAEFIKEEKLVCSPTDTLYGLIGSSLSKAVFTEIYRLKRRNPEKPLIVIFNSLDRAEELGVLFPEGTKEKLNRIFPERLTVVLPLKENSPLKEITGRGDIAIRVPKDEFLLKVIELSHPLFAPSANPEGGKPAENCSDCYNYFKNRVSLCVEGKTYGRPSTLVSLLRGKPELLRKGAFPFEKLLEVFSEKD